MTNGQVILSIAALYGAYRVLSWWPSAKAAREWMGKAGLEDKEIIALNQVNEASPKETVVAALSAHEKLHAAVRLVDSELEQTRANLERQGTERRKPAS